MTRTFIYTLFLLVIVQNAFGASLLRQLNDGVSKINELIRDINDVRDAQSARDWRRPPLPASYDYEPSMKRATLALNHAAKLLEQMRSFLKRSPRDYNGDTNEKLRPLSVEMARRTLISAEGQITNSQREDTASDSQDIEEVRDKEQVNMEKLQEPTRANSAEDATMKPPKSIGPSPTGQQIFNNLFYEAIGNTMRETLKEYPHLQKEFGPDWDPITLMTHKRPR